MALTLHSLMTSIVIQTYGECHKDLERMSYRFMENAYCKASTINLENSGSNPLTLQSYADLFYSMLYTQCIIVMCRIVYKGDGFVARVCRHNICLYMLRTWKNKRSTTRTIECIYQQRIVSMLNLVLINVENRQTC